ncbi:MAG: hypothetical protein QM781_02290 [Chitinophagaceae bacterium]
MRKSGGFLLLLLLCYGLSWGQPPTKNYTIRNGRMWIELSKHLSENSIDSFIVQFDLGELGIKTFMRTGIRDSLLNLGWQLDKNTPDFFIISKALEGFDKIGNPAEKILFTEKKDEKGWLAPFSTTQVPFGVNQFRNKAEFRTSDSVVTFFLCGYANASGVVLSGSFINWSPTALHMTLTDSGWIRQVKLAPGKHWYKFIVDGNWITDKDNVNQENDGQGNINSVYYKPNVTIRLDSFTQAKKVILSGSFNEWRRNELAMKPTSKGWALSLYLPEGTHTYRFIVDGRWMADPFNPDRMPNEYHDFNSVIKIGKPYIFQLDGFADARQVILTGSFNKWRKDELFMKRTATGWELPYTLGAGNYSYHFIIDGKVAGAEGRQENFFFVIAPNYKFRLKGFAQAKEVFLSGDFNDWAPGTFRMTKEGDEWVFDVHLTPGKHLYKFVVDGKWIIDPANKDWEQNEHNTGNSVIWIEPGKW